MSSLLFNKQLRPHIYAIYGMVRLADEIVDSYRQPDMRQQLDALHAEVERSLESGYSSNPLIHAFAQTAQKYQLTNELIDPFFASMAVDIAPRPFNKTSYRAYIYGSAEVVGLMCLKVFIEGDALRYTELKPGATALGAAYQEVNFLRDIRADYEELGRMYFPNVTFDTFNEADKTSILETIDAQFNTAAAYIERLPKGSRKAVRASMYYYRALLKKLRDTPVGVLKTRRVRITNAYKLLLLAKAALRP